MAKSNRDIYQEVTDRIIDALEAAKEDGAKLPWIKGWKNEKRGASLAMPHNAATGRAYSGVNVLLLWITDGEYSSNGWLTFKQAKDLGGSVRKGEKGTRITFFKPLRIKEPDNAGNETEKNVPLLRSFTVFNVDQCDLPEDAKIHTGPTVEAFTETAISEVAVTVGADIHMGGNRACFVPPLDQIHMPKQSQFKDADEFESVLAHELTHWTGHKSRLDRDMSGRFGDAAYAFEELVAELGAAFLCAQFGIEKKSIQEGHAAYIQHWVNKMREDKKAIFGASSLARQSNEWIVEAATQSLQEMAA